MWVTLFEEWKKPTHTHNETRPHHSNKDTHTGENAALAIAYHTLLHACAAIFCLFHIWNGTPFGTLVVKKKLRGALLPSRRGDHLTSQLDAALLSIKLFHYRKHSFVQFVRAFASRVCIFMYEQLAAIVSGWQTRRGNNEKKWGRNKTQKCAACTWEFRQNTFPFYIYQLIEWGTLWPFVCWYVYYTARIFRRLPWGFSVNCRCCPIRHRFTHCIAYFRQSFSRPSALSQFELIININTILWCGPTKWEMFLRRCVMPHTVSNDHHWFGGSNMHIRCDMIEQILCHYNTKHIIYDIRVLYGTRERLIHRPLFPASCCWTRKEETRETQRAKM